MPYCPEKYFDTVVLIYWILHDVQMAVLIKYNKAVPI